MTRLPLTVVVPTRDRADRLAGCLDALLADVGPDDEVLVVDSASADDATAAVARSRGVAVLRLDRPGSSRARNAGWRAASTPLVAFVDDDMRCDAGWADAIATAARPGRFATGRVGLLPGQEDVDRPVALTTATGSGPLDLTGTGVVGCSGNMAVHVDDLRRVGGFDERIGPGTWFAAAEDLDLFDRLGRAGTAGWFCHDAVTRHEQWRDRAALVRLDWGYGKGAGARLRLLAGSAPRQARRAAAELFLREGLRPLLRDLRGGYRLGVATLLARMGGAVVGFAAALVRLRGPWGSAP